jgi:hypothetical protein
MNCISLRYIYNFWETMNVSYELWNLYSGPPIPYISLHLMFCMQGESVLDFCLSVWGVIVFFLFLAWGQVLCQVYTSVSHFFLKVTLYIFPHLLIFSFFHYSCIIHRAIGIVRNTVCSPCNISHLDSDIHELKTSRFYSKDKPSICTTWL